MEGETAAFRNNTGTKAAVVAVDEGAAVSILVCGGKIDGVAMVVGWGAVDKVRRGFSRVEDFGPFREVGARYHFCGGDFDNGGISDKPGGVGEGNTEGFDHGMQVFGAIVVFFGECADAVGVFQFFKDAEGHKCDDALAIGWVLPYFYAVLGGTLAELAI